MRWKSMCQIAGIKEAFVVSVRAVLQIFYRVPDGAPGYLAGFTSEEISRCFREVGKDEVESRPAVWQRFFTADGRAGFERTRIVDLSERDWRGGGLYLICDREKLLTLLKKYPEAVLRFDRPCSP